MPFNTFPYPRKRSSVSSASPFALIPTSVSIGTGKYVSNTDFDCACPCNDFVPRQFITSGKMMQLSQQSDVQVTKQANSQTRKAIKVSINSYLFKGLVAPSSFVGGLGQFSPASAAEENPTVKIYGLNVPIILDGFLNVNDPKSKETLKIWLTCCYASGDSSGTGGFAGCKNKVDEPDEKLSCGYKGIFPQVAFISAGKKWPEQLATRKIVNRGTTARPLYDKRTIESHVPIGEVGVSGAVIVQYLKQNLMLTDLCSNGAPVKYPCAMFSEGAILPITY